MKELDKKKIVILATEGLTTNLLYNELLKYYDVQKVILENKISKKVFLKNRVKCIGFFKVVGQIMFMMFVVPILTWRSKGRVNAILAENKVNSEQIPHSLIKKIESVNNKEIVDLIRTVNPELIFVNGTRIISRATIESINIKMVNIHVGITPKYRGVHGGYWAVYNNDLANFGTTLHYIDSGIDTGKVIAQKITEITEKDNFISYPIIQYVNGLDLIKENVERLNNVIEFTPKVMESKLYYHPTFRQYLLGRLFRGVK